MVSSRVGTLRARRLAFWSGLAICWLLPSVGCQVEYAGMTLPSGKYMYDDVQYFPPGPDFPWANTQAATQRARMRAEGIDVGPSVPTGGPIGPPTAAGALAPVQNVPGRPTNVNVMEPEGAPGPEGAAVPPEAGEVPPANVVPPPGGVPAPGNVVPRGAVPPGAAVPEAGGDFGPK